MEDLNQLRKTLLSFICRNYEVAENSIVWKYAADLLERFESGSICVDVLESDLEEVKKSRAVSYASGNDIAYADGEIRPLVLRNEKLYVQKYFEYQKIIVEKIRELQECKNLKIISGGPGTGKTTSLKEILTEKLSNNPNLKILLAAPTGKAALRMKSAMENFEPLTLHRLLGYKPLSPNFRHNRENPLNADIIVVDESSMVDLRLMSSLCDAMPKNCELYLLGDKKQLPSVECGSVFADLCDSKCLKPSINIKTKSYRFKDDEGIGKLSKDIQELGNASLHDNNLAAANILDNLKNDNYAPQVKFFNVEFDGGNFIFKKKLNDLFNAVDAHSAFAALDSFQILCAMRKGKFGTERVNANLSIVAREKKAKYIPIIIMENDYEHSLFNGDIGLLENNTAYFKNFKNGKDIKSFSKLLLPKFEKAFAITIHKSQGSEYDKVAMMIPNSSGKNATGDAERNTIITRELIYTGITRAKKHAAIFSSDEAFCAALTKSVYRASGITEEYDSIFSSGQN